MEEMEVTSWMTLDAIKKAAVVVESVGDLQSGHCEAIFCRIEDDFLELCYSDTASNYIRRYEDKEEFDLALEKRREEFGEAIFDEDRDLGEDYEEMEGENVEDYEDSDKY